MLLGAKPRWRFRPTLLEIDEKGSVASTGLAMKVRMIVDLGLRRGTHGEDCPAMLLERLYTSGRVPSRTHDC